MSKIIHTFLERRVKQDKDIEDKKGSQPAKYHSGLDKETKQKRDAHFQAKKKGPAPGDDQGVTKKSVHTKKYEKMFGEELSEKDMTAISSWKKNIKKVKGLTKDQLQVLSTLPTPVITALINQVGMVVAGDENIQEEKITGLVNKSKKSGIAYGILKKVYDRGMAAYKTGHRPGTTAQQWAFARVNSFITKGSGTWGKADKDLAQKVKGESFVADEDFTMDEACWDTHMQKGMKKKGGKMVPNCVPKEDLGADADAGDYIDDFRKSDAPQFKGKSDKKIRKMAVAAYLSKKGKKK